MNRREFLQKTFIALPIVAIAACTNDKKHPEVEEKPKEPDTSSSVTFVSEDDPMAKNLAYVADASSASSEMRVEKSGVKGMDQYCHNCMFYIAEDGKSYGPCQLLPKKGMVHADGWCKSWAPKPA
ncbi:MAG: high-potential iron-sulfur protein [Bdellovibrionales bacterium]|nr:high-potential iron-sulfur protein [Bdellovibrionales bacterium]